MSDLSAGLELSQAEYCSLPQKKQEPQAITKGTTTFCPTWRLVLPRPTSTTSPMNSWPRMSPRCMDGMTLS